ncbi:hypothetical protein LCGC14_2234910 [marine sediment metagenome]|uniref:Uncharacterized protein n=1 Tax=marine sediment metagenome TaxID=412755 RepID=A0A0F9D7D5_9ZZZZ
MEFLFLFRMFSLHNCYGYRDDVKVLKQLKNLFKKEKKKPEPPKTKHVWVVDLFTGSVSYRLVFNEKPDVPALLDALIILEGSNTSAVIIDNFAKVVVEIGIPSTCKWKTNEGEPKKADVGLSDMMLILDVKIKEGGGRRKGNRGIYLMKHEVN